MRVPIRIIGIVTSIFWIFLIIFAFSAVYSIKDMQFSLGEPEATPTQDNNILLAFPVSVTNTGYYDLASFNVSMRIMDNNGSEVTRGSTLIPVVAPGQDDKHDSYDGTKRHRPTADQPRPFIQRLITGT